MEGKKKGEKSRKSSKERKIEKELMWIIGFLVLLVIIFFVASAIFRSFNTFEYEGLTFSQEKIGNIPVYHYSYYYASKGGGLIQYNLFLRNDPRESKVGVEGDLISFKRNEVVFISINTTALEQCSDSVVAIADLANFLVDNEITVKSGNQDFWEAGLKKERWVACESKPNNIVIEINEDSSGTEIDIEENCYEIRVANCEIMDAVEKFRVQSVVDARKTNPEGRITVS